VIIKRKSLSLFDAILVLSIIIMVCAIFYFIGNYFEINSFLYAFMVFLLIILTSLLIAIAIFQFVKMKYVGAVKNDIKADMDNYKAKIGDKIFEVNNRIGHFEADYSKKLKKVMKDYAVKVKEVEDIKKALEKKIIEMDRRTAELEVEMLLLRVERIERDQKLPHYIRIVQLNNIYPGICDETLLKEIDLFMIDNKEVSKI
jgi:septal ring factor EnvC (AmiA/AmiB activator)